MNRIPVTREFLDFTRRAAPVAPAGVALGARSAIWARWGAGQYEDQSVRPWVKIIWCLSGAGAIRVSGRTYHLRPGATAVFFPGMRHEAWAARDNPDDVWEARWVTMDGPLCAAVAQACGIKRAGIYYPATDPLGGLFDRYRDGIAQTTPAGARAAEIAAFELLVHIGASASAPEGIATVDDPVVKEAMALLRLNWPNADFGVAQLARRIGVHRSVLSRRFRKQIGVPPQKYLTDLRLSNALNLLQSTDLSIREIAFQCGFDDPGYFTRLFGRTQGVSPKEYRRVGV